MLHGALAILLLATLALLVWAWRGRRIDDHPLCRRCGYDLSGSPQPWATCSECGRDISNPKQRRSGHRARRTRTLLFIIPLLLLLLTTAGLDGYVTLKGIDTIHYKPTWLLLREVRPGGNSPAAIEELIRRSSSGTLSVADTKSLVLSLIQIHGLHSAAWQASWSRFIEIYLPSLDTEFQDRYWTDCVVLSLQVDKDQTTQNLRVSMNGSLSRNGTGNYWCYFTAKSLRVGGIECDPGELSGGREYMRDRGSRGGGTCGMIYLVPTSDSAGFSKTITIEYVADVKVLAQSTVARWTSGTRTFRQELQLPIGYRPVRFVQDRDQGQFVREHLRIADVSLNDERCVIKGTITAPSTALAYRAILKRHNEKTGWTVGKILCAPNATADILIDSPVYGWTGILADIALEPDGELAASRQLSEYMGEPVVLQRLPVSTRVP